MTTHSKEKDSVCSDFIEHFPEYSCVTEKPFGSGASGDAFLISNGSKKFVMKAQEVTPKSKQELSYLEKLSRSPYVVKLIDSFSNNRVMVFIIQFGERGTLFNLIKDRDPYFNNFTNVMKFTSQIFQGIRAIHKAKIIHADLKLENIVVTEDYTPLIIDFDLAVEKNKSASLRGTRSYMAPELIRSRSNQASLFYTEKVDLYSFGIIFYAMWKGTFPFKYKPFDFQDMISKEVHFSEEDPTLFYKLVKHLVSLPTNRYKDKELEELMSKINFDTDWMLLGKARTYSMASQMVDEDSSGFDFDPKSKLGSKFNGKSNLLKSPNHSSADGFFKHYYKEILSIFLFILVFGGIVVFVFYLQKKNDNLVEDSIMMHNVYM
jgi:serine/threonine protein kinase